MVIVRVRNVEIDYRNARFEHRRPIAERLRCQRIEEIGEAGIAGGGLDDIAVEVLDGTAWLLLQSALPWAQ
jgi:hypothetical protein